MNKIDSVGFGKLEEICDIFNMINIVKVSTCYIKIKKSTIDLLLTNKPLSFRVTNITESGLSDCDKLISLFIKSYVSRLKPKTKIFEGEKFVKDVKVANFSLPTSDPNNNYLVHSNTVFLLRRKYRKEIMPIYKCRHEKSYLYQR